MAHYPVRPQAPFVLFFTAQHAEHGQLPLACDVDGCAHPHEKLLLLNSSFHSLATAARPRASRHTSPDHRGGATGRGRDGLPLAAPNRTLAFCW